MTEFVETPEKTTSQLFQEATEDFANLMKQYDELKAADSELRPIFKDDTHSELLDSIDPSIPYDLQPVEFARSALAIHLRGLKIREVTASMHQLERQSIILGSSSDFIGQSVRIVKVNENAPSIGTSKINNYGLLDGLGQWHDEIKGKIEEVNFHPASGGFIQVRRFRKYYSVSPYISRSDYQPNYTVEFV